MLTISLSLVVFLSVFATLVISRQGYYFNSSGLSACDIFYIRPSFRMLSACVFYFPATMLFMYCYGSLYHFSYRKYALRNSLRNFNLKSAKSPPVSTLLAITYIILHFRGTHFSSAAYLLVIETGERRTPMQSCQS